MRTTGTKQAPIDNHNLAASLRQIIGTTGTNNSASNDNDSSTRHRGPSSRKPAHIVGGLCCNRSETCLSPQSSSLERSLAESNRFGQWCLTHLNRLNVEALCGTASLTSSIILCNRWPIRCIFWRDYLSNG